ncbi:MAG: hypothetical protein Q9177_000469 [Variospora cf. flavescens]
MDRVRLYILVWLLLLILLFLCQSTFTCFAGSRLAAHSQMSGHRYCPLGLFVQPKLPTHYKIEKKPLSNSELTEAGEETQAELIQAQKDAARVKDDKRAAFMNEFGDHPLCHPTRRQLIKCLPCKNSHIKCAYDFPGPCAICDPVEVDDDSETIEAEHKRRGGRRKKRKYGAKKPWGRRTASAKITDEENDENHGDDEKPHYSYAEDTTTAISNRETDEDSPGISKAGRKRRRPESGKHSPATTGPRTKRRR